jgi:hypothetical protein
MRQWRGEGGDDDGPDADLAFLSPAQASLLHGLFREAMAERGRELVVDGDGKLRDSRGTLYDLRNIAVLCRDDPGGEKEWPVLIAGYADHLLKVDSREARAEVAALTPERARDLVYLAVFPAASMGPNAAGYRSAPELAPGLLELLTLDMPDSTTFLDDTQVARLGGRESLREAARANLRALPVPVHRRIGTADAHFEAIEGDSHFTASRVLVMPDLLSRVLGTDAPHGVLVAIPARQWAFIHVLADQTATPSLLRMAKTARIWYGREQGPISPHVFWWRDGGWMPILSDESDGKVTLRPGAELSFLLTDLATRPPRGR